MACEDMLCKGEYDVKCVSFIPCKNTIPQICQDMTAEYESGLSPDAHFTVIYSPCPDNVI